jgi:TonB-linked SusC/RagA family outer membrane protein
MRKFHYFMMGVLLLITANLQAQTKQITGKITDPFGAPIPGATVKVKGSKGGTSAGFDGAFTVNVPLNGALIITGIGYETKEIRVGNASSLTITLNTDAKSLSEVVVTGVGAATSKRHIGISVESVGADKLPAAPTASIDQALVGKIPGAQISSISGNPGAPVNILLRGINTLQSGTQPMILVDGIEAHGTDIGSLDLSNIERVEVVQGAASATLYGAQGANGVIQIITKKGKRGAAAVNFSSSYVTDSYINDGHVHKSALHPYLTDANNNIINYSTGQPLAFQDDGTITGISYTFGGATRYGIVDPRNINEHPYNANLKYYDQFKEMFQTGSILNNTINVSGASDKSDFALTVSNNHNITPVLKNGYVDRTNLTANLGTELFKGFRIRSITQLIYTKNTLAPTLGSAGGYGGGRANTIAGQNFGTGSGIYGFMNTSPFFDLNYKLADGTHPIYQVADFLSVNSNNPVYVNEYGSSIDNKIDVIQNFNANYKVNKFLELDAKYGIDYRTENARWTYLNQSTNVNSISQGDYQDYFGSSNLGEIDNWNYNSTFQNFNTSLYFRTDFQNDFHINIPLQTSTQVSFDYRKNKYVEYDTYGLQLPLVPPINMSQTASQAVAEDYVEPFITYGYLVNQKLDFGNFGGISGGFRTDYSSAFGAGSKPFTFPRADAYILPSSFGFWEDSKLVDAIPYFKLRAAYGEAGIQPEPFDRYPNLSAQNLGSQLVYTAPTTVLNPNLNVEVSKEFETGADFSIHTNKGHWLSAINASFTYWTRKSDNVIYSIGEPPSFGSPLYKTNAINLGSNGVQFQLNLPVYQSRDITWDFTVNFGHQISKITHIDGADIPISSAADVSLILKAGEKIGQLYGLKALTSTAAVNQEGVPYLPHGADLGKYEIVEGRLVDTTTKQIQFSNESYAFGDPNPKFNASFINSFSYKGFITFGFQFDWIYGSHLYNQTKEWMYRDGISGDYDKQETINGQTAAWTAYRASAYYNMFGSQYGPGNDAVKDYFYESASFLRLRNASLGFDFVRFMKPGVFKKLQLVFTGRNLWTATKYTGFDPEVSSGTANSAFDRGVDHNSTPNLKSYQVALNVGF